MAQSTSSNPGEVMRVVLSPTLKEDFHAKCIANGQSMSDRMRRLIVEDLAKDQTPADRLSTILNSAEVKNQASGLPTPTIEDIDAFIDSVREERVSTGHVA